MRDQWDCFLNDLEEVGDKEFLVLTSQYNIESVSCCLRVLPFCSSTFHQNNAESSQIRSEDNLQISRIQSHHLLVEVTDHDEEEYSIFLPLGTRYSIEFLVQYSSIILSRICAALEDVQVVEGLLGVALALDRLANANTSVFVVEVSCTLSSYFLSIKSVTNLFKP